MAFQRIAIIVAHDQHRLIGDQQRLPWMLPPDLQNFKRLTLGHAVIMGRKTFDSIGKPLAGRLNIVISRTPQKSLSADNTDKKLIFVSSLEEAMNIPVAGIEIDNQPINQHQVFIIGGQQIYEQSLALCHELYVTRIEASFAGDAYFPDYSSEDWKSVSSETRQYQDLSYAFLHLKHLIHTKADQQAFDMDSSLFKIQPSHSPIPSPHLSRRTKRSFAQGKSECV